MENVAEVMEKVAVERRKEVWSRRDIVPGPQLVPDPQLEEIYQKYSTEEQRIHACADIYVNCNPDSSWIDLCKVLYGKNEMTAARKAKIFIPQTGEWYRVSKWLVLWTDAISVDQESFMMTTFTTCYLYGPMSD